MSLYLISVTMLSIPIDWTNVTSPWISIISLIIAIISVTLSVQSSIRGKPNLSLEQTKKKKSSVIIEPEWEEDNIPDEYADRRYRLLIEVTLKNKSSNPISISSFTLNDYFEYTQYSNPGDEYKIETKSGRHNEPNGIEVIGRGKVEVFPIYRKWIKPIITIQPFGIVQGYLFWPIYEDDLGRINDGRNKLTIETTSKPFNFDVFINEEIYRDKSLDHRKKWTNKSSLK